MATQRVGFCDLCGSRHAAGPCADLAAEELLDYLWELAEDDVAVDDDSENDERSDAA